MSPITSALTRPGLPLSFGVTLSRAVKHERPQFAVTLTHGLGAVNAAIQIAAEHGYQVQSQSGSPRRTTIVFAKA